MHSKAWKSGLSLILTGALIGIECIAPTISFADSTVSANATVYNIDASQGRTAISPYIYGKNFWEWNAENLVSSRLGGNRLTGYNWENNASNAGSDWNQSSDNYLGDTNVPGKVVTDFHDKNQSLGMNYSLVTLPMAGYVSRDKNGNVSSSEVAPSARWDQVIASKWSSLYANPDLNDGKVYVDEEVNFLVNKYGKANSNTGIKGYSLDNEPALWPSTHPRIHPNKTTVKEMIEKSTATALAVKNIDPSAEIFGAVTYGFAENYHMQDAPDWSDYSSYASYIDAYLAKLKQASDTSGKRLLDVLDVHWYPEAQGANNSGGKTRITEDNTDVGVANARMQAPRSLWDPSYVEDSWIGQWFTHDAFPLIPKLKSSIDTQYPGTKLAFTEFDYGGKNHISGGIATADVLGIFGKYGVYFATYWGDITGYTSSAYKLYRNYDGNKWVFGDTEVGASNPDPVNTSIYASTEWNGGKVHVILINKKSSALLAHINLANTSATQADIYGFDATSATLRKFATVSVSGNILEYEMPATSAIHIVFNNGSTVSTTSSGSTSSTGSIGSSSSSSTSGGSSSSSSNSSSTSSSSSGGNNSSSLSSSSSSNNASSSTSGGITTTGGSGGTPIKITPLVVPTSVITPIGSSGSSFSDIRDSFAKADIEDLYQRGVIHGFPDGTFRPNRNISRAEFLKIVLSSLDVVISVPAGQTSFRDVTVPWQMPIVETAADLWIISRDTGNFRPDAPITRAEAIKILMKAAGLNGTTTGASFSDVGSNYDWARPYINQAYTLGIMSGQNGRFRPADPITRAEAAKIVRKTKNRNV